MSNRVYLSCTNFSEFPTARQTDEFFRVSGTEYEAKACIPIFWMCLFSSPDIKIVPANHDGFDDDSRPYAYLLCSKSNGLALLKSRAPMMEKALGPDRFTLYSEWMSRIDDEPFENILVRTAELDWMGQEGELEQMLRKAFKHFQQVDTEGLMRMSNAMNDVAGIWQGEALNECESFELVGSANLKESWPHRFTPIPVPAKSASSVNKPLASLSQRFNAQFVDGLVALFLGFVAFQIAKAVDLPLWLPFVAWLLYLLLCDGFPKGQSLGKMLTKIAVVDVRTNQPCGYSQSVFRNAPLLVLGIFDAIFVFGKQRRRLGDFLASTKVVRLDLF
jgi:uncharacterized RDD family membrane protein YckC